MLTSHAITLCECEQAKRPPPDWYEGSEPLQVSISSPPSCAVCRTVCQESNTCQGHHHLCQHSLAIVLSLYGSHI